MPLRDQARDLVRNGLRRAGFDVRRVGRRPRRALEDVTRNARACGLAAGGIIDVGVAKGTPGLYDAWPEAQLLLVDPLVEWEGHLRHLTTGRGSYVMAAAGACEGSTEVHVHRIPELSSVMGDRDEVDALGGQTTLRVVDVVTLDAIADELPGPLVIKVDVEGAELDVLRGATTVLARTELVLLETSLFEFLPGQPLVHEVVSFMAERGFVIYDVFGGHLRLLDGALAQVDLAFARGDGILRRDQRYASPDQADTLYRSWAARSSSPT
jgi:FkbM family methyltransferase